MTILHLMIIPPISDAHGDSNRVAMFLIWMAPFLVLYVWHWWHDHRHNHILEKRLAEIVDRLDRILEHSRKSGPS